MQNKAPIRSPTMGAWHAKGTPDPSRQVNAKALSQSQHESDWAVRSS